VSTFIGMGLGLASGYFGGATDMIIQRASDIVANVPLLPLLIFLVFIGGSKLWLILLVLVAFSWPGLTIMVRTMVLQLRTGQEVEAAQALGASGSRVVVRHILPHAASFVLAQLVFSAPSAILAEAGLSFLGLGDPSLPTWGQILEYGFRTGAVYLGYWWWVIPPGLAIVVTAVTFMFLALGLEPVVDPRLRGRRLWRS
jgi:peptide/nickel transport system permease protein